MVVGCRRQSEQESSTKNSRRTGPMTATPASAPARYLLALQAGPSYAHGRRERGRLLPTGEQ